MTLVPYQALFTRILGNDNLWAGMSSFVVEMTEFRSILRGAGPKTLVLGDELCAGTETISATAIVAAGIQTLVEKKTQFLFATHLHELMDMSEIKELSTVKPYHLTVQADTRPGGKLIYDRQLKRGSGSPMYGLEVCRGLDMDSGFLAKAIQIRKQLENTPSIQKVSRYNAAVPIQMCNVCGAKEGLETHHIVPQAEANQAGFVDVGKHKNDVGNLVILCDSCHSKHHSGALQIGGWIQTSAGKELVVR
jgi:DNA mismatch repair protein MutS